MFLLLLLLLNLPYFRYTAPRLKFYFDSLCKIKTKTTGEHDLKICTHAAEAMGFCLVKKTKWFKNSSVEGASVNACSSSIQSLFCVTYDHCSKVRTTHLHHYWLIYKILRITN